MLMNFSPEFLINLGYMIHITDLYFSYYINSTLVNFPNHVHKSYQIRSDHISDYIMISSYDPSQPLLLFLNGNLYKYLSLSECIQLNRVQ